METNHVHQNNGKVGGVGRDETPRDGLGPRAGIPGCGLARAGDGEGQGSGGKEEGGGEGGEGTHRFGREGDRRTGSDEGVKSEGR